MNNQKSKIKKEAKKYIPKDWLCELRILYRLTMETFYDIKRTGIVNLAIITTMAAILTIVGYSINDTVVILDRVRSNMRTLNVSHFTDILNVSLSETLSRTIYTTLTTLVAVLSLYIFTTGSMKDFALALIVGMISGAYSSIYISSAIIALIRRNWKPSDEVKAVPVYQRNSFDTEFSE